MQGKEHHNSILLGCSGGVELILCKYAPIRSFSQEHHGIAQTRDTSGPEVSGFVPKPELQERLCSPALLALLPVGLKVMG